MLKKVIYCIFLLSIIFSLNLLVVATDNSYVKHIEDSYYISLPSQFSFDLCDYPIDKQSVAERYIVDIDISSLSGQKEFLNIIDTGKILDVAQKENSYNALCAHPLGEGTAILSSDGRIQQVYVADSGDLYSLQLTDRQLQKELENSLLELNNTSAKFIGLPMYAEGILFSDDATEYFLPKILRNSSLKVGHLYSMQDVAKDIEENSEILIYEPLECQITNGKANPEMGRVEDISVYSSCERQFSLFVPVIGFLFTAISFISFVYFSRKVNYSDLRLRP